MCVVLVFFIALLSAGSKKALKNSDLNRDSNPDLCDAGAGALPVKLPSGFLEFGRKVDDKPVDDGNLYVEQLLNSDPLKGR